MGWLILAFAMLMCGRWFFQSDIADAVAESIRARHGERLGPGALERLEELTEQLDAEVRAIRADVGELAERVEFTERALLQVRDSAGLPASRSSA